MSKVAHPVYWAPIVLAYFSLFALGLFDNLRSPFFPDIATELQLPDGRASLFFAATSVVAFITGLCVPRLIRKLGLLNSVRTGLFILSLGFAAISVASDLFTLVMASATFGAGFGIINVAQNILVLESVKGVLRRRLLSGLHGMYALAALTAPVVAAFFFDSSISWKKAFLWMSLVGCAALIYSFFVKIKIENQAREDHRDIKKSIRNDYVIVGGMLSLYIISEVLISTRLPLYLRRVFNYSPQQSAEILAIFFILLLAGRVLFLFFNSSKSNLKIIEWSLVSSLAFYTLGTFAHPYFITICGLTMAPIFGLSVDFIADLFKSRANDAVSVCVTLSGVFLVIMHYSVGYFTELYGIRNAMLVGIFTLALSLILLQKVKQLEKVKVSSEGSV